MSLNWLKYNLRYPDRDTVFNLSKKSLPDVINKINSFCTEKQLFSYRVLYVFNIAVFF
jgi:hypothetical protein